MPSFREQPLIYRLVNRAQSGQQAGYDEAYARIVRQLRKFSATSVVEAALRLLWTEYPTKIDALQTAPWHILLIVKWALRDPYVSVRVGPSIPADVFNGVRQAVLDLVGIEHKRNPPANVFLMMRAHLQQVDFQRPEGWGFIRWPALISREAEKQITHRQFRDTLGLPPAAFIDLSFGLFAAVMLRQLPIGTSWLEPMRATYGASVDAMWRLVARDIPGLREELRRDDARRLPARQELFEFPYLKRFPLIRMRDGRYHCWHPMVYARGLEDLVHIRLTDLGEEDAGPFSYLFERHVVELSRAMSVNTIDENAYRLMLGGRPSTVEAVLPYGHLNVLVEAKMGLYRDDVLLTDNEEQAHQKTKKLRDGIKQAWAVGGAIRQPNSPFCLASSATEDFLLLVKSRELFIGDGTMLQRLFPNRELEYPDEQAKLRLPLHNVFVISIDTYERLSCAVAAGEVNLSDLMSEAAANNQDPATASMLFDGYLDKYVKQRRWPKLIEDAKREAEQRVAVALGSSPDAFRRNDGDA